MDVELAARASRRPVRRREDALVSFIIRGRGRKEDVAKDREYPGKLEKPFAGARFDCPCRVEPESSAIFHQTVLALFEVFL